MAQRPFSRPFPGPRPATEADPDRPEPTHYDFRTPLSESELALLHRLHVSLRGGNLLDKTHPAEMTRDLKQLVALGLVGRDRDGSFFVSRFGVMRLNQLLPP